MIFQKREKKYNHFHILGGGGNKKKGTSVLQLQKIDIFLTKNELFNKRYSD